MTDMKNEWQAPGYRVYSEWLKQQYGEKVYKLPVNMPVSCPNRDGTLGVGGCIYCGETGGGQENLSCELSVKEQLDITRKLITKKYKAQKFIPFFQSFSNTYCPLEQFQNAVLEAVEGDDIVGLSVATRPDCLFDEHLAFLQNLQQDRGVDVTIELGLQTANDATLIRINRGHTLGDYIQGAIKVKSCGLGLCTHVILDLPWDQRSDVVTTAQVVSAVGSDFVKCHALYVESNTALAKMLKNGSVMLYNQDEYLERCVLFLQHLAPDIIIQRIIGRSPAKDSIITNWNTGWWKVRDRLHARLEAEKIIQGMRYGRNRQAVYSRIENKL